MLKLTLHFITILMTPIFVMGIINRTKAIWAGRKGPKLSQFFFDLRRLLEKAPVYSETSSWIFQLAPWIVLVTSCVAAFLCPMMPGYSPFSFSYDFIYFAYLFGVGRAFLILGALDTGSSFEGMGASREATFSTLIEPCFFLAMGTLGIVSGHTSFQDLVLWNPPDLSGYLLKAFLASALFILLQIEAARVPVDDPNTHLELTMIHEVMILDHSGPELAAIQYGAAIKLTIISGLIAALLNPISATDNALTSWGISIGMITFLAIGIGLIESFSARLKLKAIPLYTIGGVVLGIVSLLVAILKERGTV